MIIKGIVEYTNKDGTTESGQGIAQLDNVDF